MKSVATGKDKVKKICEVLKRETLDPAKKEADAIIHQAREGAAKIIEEARSDAKKVHSDAKKQIDEERNVFESSIHLACKKSLSTLKQEIEEKLLAILNNNQKTSEKEFIKNRLREKKDKLKFPKRSFK